MQWDGIDEFLQVVESGSFSRAADYLGLSNSQVSKRVAGLEARLGTRLLHRTTRRLALTDEGEAYYRHCREAHRHLRAAEASISGDAGELTGTLRLNLAGAFQEQFLVPLLGQFLSLHPLLRVELDFSDRLPDLLAGGHDLSICPGPPADSSMGGNPLAAYHCRVVAAPTWLEQHGTPQEPADLRRFNCLVGTDPVWHFSDGVRERRVRVSGNWKSENSHALRGAVRAGIGLARLPYFALEEDLAAGHLREVLADWNRYQHEVWALYPDTRYVPARVRKFLDFLAETWRIGPTPWPPPGGA